MAMSAKKRGKQPQHPRYFRTECPWIDEELPYDTDTSSEDNSSSSEEEFTPASHTLKQQQREESDSDWEMNAPSHLVKPKTNIKKKRKLQPPSKPKADKPRATPKKKAPQQRFVTLAV